MNKKDALLVKCINEAEIISYSNLSCHELSC